MPGHTILFGLVVVAIAAIAGLYARLLRKLSLQRGEHGRFARARTQLLARAEQRVRYLEFLNSVSKLAISNQDAEQMLKAILDETQRNFGYDHIDIGVLDYATNEIVIRAEAGQGGALGKRLPLDDQILSRAIHEKQPIQLEGEAISGHTLRVLYSARSILYIPLIYGRTCLGILNLESRQEAAFPSDEILALNTFADLVATALHNALVFQQVQQQAITDGLTGLKTRRFFGVTLQTEWKRASRNGRPFSLIMLDLDHLKQVNDARGHVEGDLVLARVGRVLEQKCRQSNVVARYGGDEFVLLMPDTTNDQAEALAERLRLWLAADPMFQDWKITGSFGVATFPQHASNPEELLRAADAAMYHAKQNGGNRIATAEKSAEPEAQTAQRQFLTSYIEGFLQREPAGPLAVEELTTALCRLTADPDREALREAVLTLARTREVYEVEPVGHGELTARHAEAMARHLKWTGEELADVVYAARIHDVGKVVIPEEILRKRGTLTLEEQTLLHVHPGVGAQIAGVIPGSERLAAIVRHHHERFAGNGYPDGLIGDDIPAGARLVAVADCYAKMITDRPNTPAMSPREALAQIEARAGIQFDPVMVKALRAAIQYAQAGE